MAGRAAAEDLAKALGIELKTLRWLTYHRKGATVVHYSRYSVPKKTRGQRAISAPLPALAAAQQWVLQNILSRCEITEHAHGFVRGKSVVTNASPHTGKKIVINLDLQNFFPTITFRRVKGLFNFRGYSEHLSTVLALLCTEPPRVPVNLDGKIYHVALSERVLPQGACTSPAITNLICRWLDWRLSGLAARHEFHYTRYADDLTFSGDKSSRVGKLLKSAQDIVRDEGFQVHPTKTRVMRQSNRQEVTGVTVNHHPTIGRQEYRTLRAILHNAAQHGLESQNRSNHPNFAAHLQGKIAYIIMLDAEKGARLQAMLDAAMRSGK